MPRHYPAEFRRQTCERLLAGEKVKDLVAELGVSEQTPFAKVMPALARVEPAPSCATASRPTDRDPRWP